MEIRMKPGDGQAGWLNRVQGAGCKATWRPAVFGRTEWLFKKDGESIRVLQGKSTCLATRVDNPTEKQREIAAVLAAAEIAVVTAA